MTNLLDHFAPSRYDPDKDFPRKPRSGGDDLMPPAVLPVGPRDSGRRVGLSEPAAESSPPPPR